MKAIRNTIVLVACLTVGLFLYLSGTGWLEALERSAIYKRKAMLLKAQKRIPDALPSSLAALGTTIPLQRITKCSDDIGASFVLRPSGDYALYLSPRKSAPEHVLMEQLVDNSSVNPKAFAYDPSNGTWSPGLIVLTGRVKLIKEKGKKGTGPF